MATSVTPDPAAGGASGSPAPAARAREERDIDGMDGEEFDVERITDGLIEKRGGGLAGARGAVRKLVWDKKKLVGKVKQLRDKVVADGDVVLRGDALAEYTRLKKLNLKPEEIEQRLLEHTELQKEVKKGKHREFLTEVAQAIGITNMPAWIKLAERAGIEIEMRPVQVVDEETKKKTTEQMPFARLVGADDKSWQQLDVYLDENEGEFRHALYAEPEEGASTTSSGGKTTHAPARKGTQMTPQGGSARVTPTDAEAKAVTDTLKNRYVRPKK